MSHHTSGPSERLIYRVSAVLSRIGVVVEATETDPDICAEVLTENTFLCCFEVVLHDHMITHLFHCLCKKWQLYRQGIHRHQEFEHVKINSKHYLKQQRMRENNCSDFINARMSGFPAPSTCGRAKRLCF